jgi:magnesium-protoporphyrin O-methyltransferase
MSSYAKRRGELEQYFDRTAADTWARLTSEAPVSGVRAKVRAEHLVAAAEPEYGDTTSGRGHHHAVEPAGAHPPESGHRVATAREHEEVGVAHRTCVLDVPHPHPCRARQRVEVGRVGDGGEAKHTHVERPHVGA